jgi:pyruvate decarboxylase
MQPRTLPLARYILESLRKNNCHALHGVPGDFSLPFLSHLQASNVKWVGNCNELNAAYAADGYARINGLGAVCTTFGVGELSALNGIAGSLAERVPVVHIVGTPRRALTAKWKTEDRGRGRVDGLIHHSLGRSRDLGVFTRVMDTLGVPNSSMGDIFDARGSHEDVARAVDQLLAVCLTRKQPVYMSMPSDLADLGVPVPANGNLLGSDDLLDYESPGNRIKPEDLAARLLQALSVAKRPIIMVDGVAARFSGQRELLNKLVAATNIPTVVTPHGLGIIDSDQSSYQGVYTGSLGRAELKTYVDGSDLVMLFGELLSDTGSVGWDATPPLGTTTIFGEYDVTVRGESLMTSVVDVLDSLLQHDKLLEAAHSDKDYSSILSLDSVVTGRTIEQGASVSESDVQDPPDSQELSQNNLYPILSSHFRPHDTILLANGTPLIGAATLSLPPDTRVIASGLWFSVGQMLPAALGVAFATQRTLPPTNSAESEPNTQGRTILLEGDGSFQATAQELSTIMRHRLDMTIFLVNNRGYAYERLIQGPDADYNDVVNWDYTLGPRMMAAQTPGAESDTTRNENGGAIVGDVKYPIRVYKGVSTVSELKKILASPALQKGSPGLNFVELSLGRLDVPSYFAPALDIVGKKLTQ